ncbi:flagellar basal body protein [Telmatospirillum sp.]|uniref:flagellar basal body protein n=1 Tax=Telmatospirillum sp. TaxID=2079197 RepID=UPI00283FB792|nr:flagellar basal body protein [Telmatospirillum sp.]MDR3438094.1 flagellar basal body protein [Telmatospirillum sp.]
MSASPLTVAMASKALDGLSMRMAALANNLANANAPRFQAVSVRFEDALRKAAAKGPEAVDALQIHFQAGHAYGPHDDRRVDLLVADAAQTAARYSALVEMLGERMSLQRAAMGGQG